MDIHDYIKKGLKKGYSKQHIKEILLKHGHKASDVKIALNQVSSKKSWYENSNYKISGIIALCLIVLILILYGLSQIGSEKTIEKDVQDYIDRIGNLSIDIEEKEYQIEAQIKYLKELNTTVEEREKILDQQIKEIEKLYLEIKSEREEIKSLLMELINSILKR